MAQENNITLAKEIHQQLECLIEELHLTKYSIKVFKGSNKGDNYLGVIAKATVTGKSETGEPKTYNFVLKCAPELEQFRQYVKIVPVYKREVLVYETLFPELLRFQHELGVVKPFHPFAKLYKSYLEAPYECLIMEDMTHHGFIMRNRRIPLNLAHSLFVMRQYGKLHALSFALKYHKPETFARLLKETREHYFTLMNLGNLSETIAKLCKDTIKYLDEERDKKLIKKVEDFSYFPQKGLVDTLSADAAGDAVVICHGDNWINNILFKYKDDHDTTNPIDLCILDWQLCKSASPAIDLSYFIFTCTDKKLRDSHYDELLKAYHASLSSFLVELQVEPVMFPYENLLEHMVKFSKYGLMMAMMVVHLMMAEADELPDWGNETPDDHDSGLFSSESDSKRISQSRIVDVVRDVERLGYF